MADIRAYVPQIEALQATAGALIAQCQALLSQAGAAAPPEPTPAPCAHSKRVSTGRMGAPDAWFCPDCTAQGDS